MLSCSRQRRILSKKLLLIDIPTNSVRTFPCMLYTCLANMVAASQSHVVA